MVHFVSQESWYPARGRSDRNESDTMKGPRYTVTQIRCVVNKILTSLLGAKSSKRKLSHFGNIYLFNQLFSINKTRYRIFDKFLDCDALLENISPHVFVNGPVLVAIFVTYMNVYTYPCVGLYAYMFVYVHLYLSVFSPHMMLILHLSFCYIHMYESVGVPFTHSFQLKCILYKTC